MIFMFLRVIWLFLEGRVHALFLSPQVHWFHFGPLLAQVLAPTWEKIAEDLKGPNLGTVRDASALQMEYWIGKCW